MNILKNTFNMTIGKSKLFAILTLILTIVNSHAVLAAGFTAEAQNQVTEATSQGLVVPKDPEPVLVIPESLPAIRTMRTTLSAYNSIPNQTDGSPFVTAAGSCVRDGVVASNAFRIGTKIRFPELFGDKVFVVEDRMNERYTNRVDVWMTELGNARKFGLKRNARVEVVEEGNGKKFWKDGWTNEKCQQMLNASIG